MKTLKPKVDQDFSVNHDAMITKADGTKVSAKEILCAEMPHILGGLEAAKALSKNFIVKMAIGIVINAVEALGEAFCNG